MNALKRTFSQTLPMRYLYPQSVCSYASGSFDAHDIKIYNLLEKMALGELVADSCVNTCTEFLLQCACFPGFLISTTLPN